MGSRADFDKKTVGIKCSNATFCGKFAGSITLQHRFIGKVIFNLSLIFKFEFISLQTCTRNIVLKHSVS